MMATNRPRLALAAAALALAAASAGRAAAFVPVPSTPTAARTPLAMTASESKTDVSVEYDAAARLAYGAWCAKFGRDPSEKRFAVFKGNYEAATVANVVAAKEAREKGTARPEDLELNEYGDLTADEYEVATAGGPAKAALEAEEEKLAAELGADGIEELEEAIDAAGEEGDDGADAEAVASGRVREAYEGWCAKYGKEADEGRYPTFCANYLAMETYSRDKGREMFLNKYADCTQEEYLALTQPGGECTFARMR